MPARAVLIALLIPLAVAPGGCGSDGDGGGATAPVTTAAASTTPAPAPTAPTPTGAEAEITECLATAPPDPGSKPSFSGAEQVLKQGSDYTIVMKTSCGTLNIALDQAAGGPIPNSVAFLVGEGFYDGLTFHRVVPDFVLQGGDPEGQGTGGPGYDVVGAVPEGYRYTVGDVAMAKTATDPPGTAGSQFFVVSGTQGEQVLTSQPVYGILGHATDRDSLATIARIAALAVSDGPPSRPVWIISAKLVEGAVT